MNAATLSPEAAAYLAELERELADLPREEREDLLEEVEASLVEGGDDPAGHLGTPARFAAELRASAGLPPAAKPAPPKEPLWTRIRRAPRTRAAAATAHELAPIWWLVRGFVVIALLSVGVQGHYRDLVPLLTGEPALDVLILSLAPILSVVLGLAGRRGKLPLRPLWVVLDVGLAIALLFTPAMYNELKGRTDSRVVFVESMAPAPAGLANNGVSLRNVYAYDRKGRLLHDVRLYDQDGKPLELGRGAPPDPNRRSVFAKDGKELFNAFPIRYFEPGTNRVAHPNAVPARLNPRPLR
jgi:hypothetical protein